MKTRALKIAGILGILMLVAAACTPPPPDNEGPFASFLPDVSNGNAPLTVNFDASASGDPDGTIVQYGRDFGDFNTGADETISHTFNTPGSFPIELTVTDDDGASASSTTVITVNGGPPPAPTGLMLTSSGTNVINTWADFSSSQVPGASQYEIDIDPTLGCIAGGATEQFPGGNQQRSHHPGRSNHLSGDLVQQSDQSAGQRSMGPLVTRHQRPAVTI